MIMTKNIHILPTDKPSRLYKHNELGFKLLAPIPHEIGQYNGSNQYIYITSDEEIKDGDWCLHFGTSYVDKVIGKQTTLVKITDKQLCGKNGGHGYFWKQWDKNPQFSYHHDGLKKIIITTDQDLIKDGVQAINDEFLEWFVKNPSCEEVEVERIVNDYWKKLQLHYKFNYKIIIPKEERERGITITHVGKPKQETLEEAAKREYPHSLYENDWNALQNRKREEFVKGAKWQQERSYSEEEVLSILFKYGYNLLDKDAPFTGNTTDEWFEQFKKK